MLMGGDIVYFQVIDNGMSADGIMIGDVVLVDRQVEASSHEIVAIILRSKTVLRRIEKIGQNYKITPSNPAMIPEFHENVMIIGRLINSVVTV
jgi:SOS-response transcriptional repressor LexA